MLMTWFETLMLILCAGAWMVVSPSAVPAFAIGSPRAGGARRRIIPGADHLWRINAGGSGPGRPGGGVCSFPMR